jgi:hypothetical protein
LVNRRMNHDAVKNLDKESKVHLSSTNGYCGQVAVGSKLRSGMTDVCGIIGRR